MEPAGVELAKLIGTGVGSALGTGAVTVVGLLSYFRWQRNNGRTPVTAKDLEPIQASLDTLLKTNAEQWALIRQNEKDIARLDERTKRFPWDIDRSKRE